MYLSKLILNPRHSLARRDISNMYEMHSTLSWVFEGANSGRFLWRLERGRDAVRQTLLVQSEALPPWDSLQSREGYLGYLQGKPESKEYVLPDRLYAGQALRFRLQANPTVTRGGKRHGLMTEEEQIAWLERQGDRHGFDLFYLDDEEVPRVSSCHVTAAERRRFRTHQESHYIVLWSVTYDGHLRVRDPYAFRQVLRKGLGHGKALGLGLLSIAPK